MGYVPNLNTRTCLLTIAVETDVAEASTPLLSLSVAQRYSVLVTARNDTSQNFLIHANME